MHGDQMSQTNRLTAQAERFMRRARDSHTAAASDALLARAADCLDHAANLVLTDHLNHAASSDLQALSDAHPDKRAHTEALSNAQ
jgi:hypothetical protein